MNYIHKNTRLLFLIVSLAIALILRRILAGSWFLPNPQFDLVFQNLLLTIVLGSTLIEAKFTKPADAFTNAILVLVTLLSVPEPNKFIAWHANAWYAGVVAGLSLVSMVAGSDDESRKACWNKLARACYGPATFLGRATLIFSFTFVLSVFSFHNTQSRDFLVLMCFWAFLVVAEPIGFLAVLQRIFDSMRGTALSDSGKLMSVTLPGVMRYEPHKDVEAKVGDFVVMRQDLTCSLSVVTDTYQLGDKNVTQTVTVTRVPEGRWKGAKLEQDRIHHVGDFRQLETLIGGDGATEQLRRFVGIVVENSTIAEIIFKLTSSLPIEEGNILETTVSGVQVLYQVVDAKTDSELLASDVKAELCSNVVDGEVDETGVSLVGNMELRRVGDTPQPGGYARATGYRIIGDPSRPTAAAGAVG